MIALIAEKPSVAKDIARIIGATQRNDGYLSGNGYMVTWAFGHLIQLAMPEAYGVANFRRESLPIIPADFQLIPRQVKAEKGYKADPGVLKQLKVIKEVFDQCDRIIVATDAGREGELIFRYIFHYLNCHKPFVRLWISSLTDRAIREGMENLQPGERYDNLYLAAKSRSEADWLIGINATQALSVAAGQGVFSLGRVQTPTLMMICDRYLENKNFVPTKFWQLKASTASGGIGFTAQSTARWEQQPEAIAALQRVKDAGQLVVKSVERKETAQEPPLLYDLTTLQKEANTKLNFSADKTLSIAQSLYEKKVMSYPRTGSRYISEDVFEEMPERIALLERYPRFAGYAAGLNGGVKVGKSIALVAEISEIYVRNFQNMLADPNFTADELAAISSGYAMLLDESSDVLQDLKNVVNVTGMSLSDAERLAVIDRAYNSLMNYRNLVNYYTRKNISVSYLRAKKKNDTDRVLALYGSADERYW